MTKPKREEVDGYIEFAEQHVYLLNPIAASLKWRLVAISKAYLAQEEDMKKLGPYIVGLVKEIADLKAENQALREERNHD